MGRHSAEEPQGFQPEEFDPRNYSWNHEAADPDAAYGSGPEPVSRPRPIDPADGPSYRRRVDEDDFGYNDPAFDVDSPSDIPPPPPRRQPSWRDEDFTEERPLVPRRRAYADPAPESRAYSDEDDDILTELRRRRPSEAHDDDDHDIDVPVDPATEGKGAGREKRPSRRFRAIAGVVGGVAAIAFFSTFSHDVDDNKNNFGTKPMVTSGPNMLPADPIESEPLDTPEERMAHVQRLVNNGDNGKVVNVLPGILTYNDEDGDKTNVKNPIIVMEGLGDDYDKLATGTIDPALFQGHIFGIEASTYDPTAGVGESYKVIPVDTTAISGWKPATGTKGDLPVEAKVAWGEDDAGQAIDGDTDKPIRQGGSNGPVIDSKSTKGKPMVIGEIQEASN